MNPCRYGKGIEPRTFDSVVDSCNFLFSLSYILRADPYDWRTDLGEEWLVDAISDLRDSKTEVVTDKLVTGVNNEALEILLERTLNALPPPKESTADAPSIIEISSRIMERCAAISSLVAS